MPTHDRHEAISVDEAHARAGCKAFAAAGCGGRLGKVGLEPELFPIFVDTRGRPQGRMPLEGPRGVIEALDSFVGGEPRMSERRGPPQGPWEYELKGGGRLTFEPGAQIEHSTAVYVSAAQALADVERVIGLLQCGFRRRGVALVAAGIDLWHAIDTVPQQLRAGRYTSMAHYYDERGPWGRVMMRHTCSLQVNLDLGPEGVWQERWLLANLVSPLVTASFACSPADGFVCLRAHAWQELDPTRTGFPNALVTGAGDGPAGAYAEAALAADVMLVRFADGSARPCAPGLSFARWIEDGHPEHGWPTRADLDYHLTTLFFEVRPRGFLELRAGEALPEGLRAAPVVLVTALLYDDDARTAALELLAGARTRLPELWRRAARDGVRDPELGALADRVWGVALEGAARLPTAYFGEEALAGARDFVERYTARQRMPADDLGELLEEDPARALAWANAARCREDERGGDNAAA